MKLSLKQIFYGVLVIVWMMLIYLFSSMNGVESHQKSKELIKKVVPSNNMATIEPPVQKENSQNTAISNKNGNEEIKQIKSKKQIINDLDGPIRKLAHACEYAILAILIMLLIFKIKRAQKLKYSLVSLFLCFLYACTDEFHQRFVPGRGSQFSDVLIDTAGSLIGIILIWIIIGIIKCIKLIILKKSSQFYKK